MRITVRATAINSGNGIPASLALGWTHPLPVSVAEQNSTNTAVPVSWGSPQLHLLHLKIRKFHLCNLLPLSTVFSQSIKFVLFTSPSFDGGHCLEGKTTYGFLPVYSRLLLVLAITLGVAAGITLLILVACFVCPGCLLHKKRRPGNLIISLAIFLGFQSFVFVGQILLLFGRSFVQYWDLPLR